MENNENQEELFIPKTKHKFLKILLATLLVAALAVGGYFLYQYKFSSSKTIVSNILESAQDNVDTIFDNANTQSGKYKVNGLLKIDGNMPDEMKGIMDLLKQVSLQFNGEIDLDNKIGALNYNTKYKNDKLLNIKTYYEKNDMYLYFEDLFDKYIKISSKDLTDTIDLSKSELNIQDSKTLIKEIIKAFQTEIEKYEILKEETTITVDEKNVDVYGNYLVLKDKEVNTFAKNIINYLLNDNDFTTAYKKVTNEDAKEDLTKSLKEIDEEEFVGTYKITFYTTKSILKKDLVRFSMEIKQNEQVTSINVDKINDNEMIISSSADGANISARIKKNNSAIGINLSMQMTGMTFKIDADLNYEEINELSKVDVSNYVKAENLTENDQAKIDENLGKNKNLVKFMEEIQKIFSQNEV